ncbi:hypothetical protein [Methanoculleus chikugoensis]|uniref:hypothetical protein n=1 Tax=Methanoculleus chikugoensis TaxID=118126 RepID=UPI0006D13BB9|nr:hypothetical protein [Methanoculleus chikugoensis]
MTGTRRDDLIGRQFRPPLVEEERTAWRNFVRGLTPKNPAATIDCRMVMPDGSTRYYRWRGGRALCSPDGTILEYQYLCSDSHEFRVIEETLRRQLQALEQEAHDREGALRESEERFRRIFEDSPPPGSRSAIAPGGHCSMPTVPASNSLGSPVSTMYGGGSTSCRSAGRSMPARCRHQEMR